jgi:acyl carrier protein
MNNILSEKDTVAIQDIIIRQLDVRRDQLMPEARILADLGADSLDVVEISMALEELFDVTIPDEQWDKVDTVGELYDELGRILQQRTHAS